MIKILNFILAMEMKHTLGYEIENNIYMKGDFYE